MAKELLFINPDHPEREPKKVLWGEEFFPEELSSPPKLASPQTIIPLHGSRVACGLFGISEDYIEKYQSLDSALVKNPSATFFFEASSSSMEPLIFEKDILVVDRSVEAYHNKIVVAALDGGLICKRLIKTPSRLILHSENRSYKDIVIEAERDFRVWGVVVGIARKLF